MNWKIVIFIILILFIILWGLYVWIKYDKIVPMSRHGSSYPPLIIYKTNADYFYNVPVYLSEDKTRVTGYPGITVGTPYPTKLIRGYLLDNRGIGENSAFMDVTYEEYNNLENTPFSEELFDIILDDNPFSEMYDCGNIGKNVLELNTIISFNSLDRLCDKVR